MGQTEDNEIFRDTCAEVSHSRLGAGHVTIVSDSLGMTMECNSRNSRNSILA